MAFQLTKTAELLSEKTSVRQQLILEIDGIPFSYGALPVTKGLEYGDGATYGDGSIYGGGIESPTSKAYVSLKRSTRSIKQQLEQDKVTVSGAVDLKLNL